MDYLLNPSDKNLQIQDNLLCGSGYGRHSGYLQDYLCWCLRVGAAAHKSSPAICSPSHCYCIVIPICHLSFPCGCLASLHCHLLCPWHHVLSPPSPFLLLPPLYFCCHSLPSLLSDFPSQSFVGPSLHALLFIISTTIAPYKQWLVGELVVWWCDISCHCHLGCGTCCHPASIDLQQWCRAQVGYSEGSGAECCG